MNRIDDAERESYERTLWNWAKELENREKENESHADYLLEVAAALAGTFSLTEEERSTFRLGSLLHDIGKIGVPEAILKKPGVLTPEEFEIVKRHSEVGYQILKDIPYQEQAAVIVRYHHEHWDGTGYPEGLSGDDIPFLARLFAVVEVWTVLRADRPFRPAWSFERTRDYIQAQSGIQFDPKIVVKFLELLEEGKIH